MTKETILQLLQKAQQESSGTFITSTETLDDYGLGGYDCEICGNKGILTRMKDGYLYSRECDCMPIRRSIRRIRKSNMSDMLTRYTLDAYETPDKETKHIKELAKKYIKDKSGWLYISGQSGSGKTHICTAICCELIMSGVETIYMTWKDESTRLKAVINTPEYKTKLEKLERVPVLYIDDFFKGGASDADVRLAFELINQRYNDAKLRTIISSEFDIQAVLSRDEALGGRIYERAKSYMIKAPQKNWRLS